MSATRSSESPDRKGHWTESKTKEGRTYWAHSITKQSVWEKPEELRTPFEKAMGTTSWKQYNMNGRVYYVNSLTKETKWDMPSELVKLREEIEEAELARIKEEEEAAKRPLAIEAGPSSTDPNSSLTTTDPFASNSDYIKIDPDIDPSTLLSEPAEPIIRIPPGGFRSFEEAEKAFMSLLRRCKVDETWTWDVTMRKIITDPLYKALNTLAEKKNAWAKYQADLLATQESRRQSRLDKSRPIITTLLSSHPRIREYSTFRTAEEIFKGDKYWMMLEDPRDREVLFGEYVRSLQVAEENARVALRNRNLTIVKSLMKELPITVYTRWKEARDMIYDSSQFKSDSSLRDIDEIDVLDIYAEYASKLIREHEEQAKKSSVARQRKGRKARDAFKALLTEMESRGQITRRSKWKETRLLLEDAPEYDNLLGQYGSTPLELWQDLVDDIQEAVDAGIEKVERALKSSGGGGAEGKIVLGMTFDEFENLLKETHLAAQIDEKLHKEVHESIQSSLQKAVDDQKRRAERKRKHAIEDLRYAMKKADPPINIEGTFEDALPAIERLREFEDLADDQEARREAFEKYVKRQKEKAAEKDSSKDHSKARKGEDGSADIDMDEKSHKRNRSESHRERRRSNSPRSSDLGRGDRDAGRDRVRDRERDRDRSDRYRDADVDDRREKRADREREKGRDRRDRDRYDDDRDRDRDDRKRRDKDREARRGRGENESDDQVEDAPPAKRSKLMPPVEANGVHDAPKVAASASEEEGEI